MYKDKAIQFNNNTYFPLRVITKAFCLENSFVEHLALNSDRYHMVLENGNDLLVPFSVFKRMKLPQDSHFFKIIAVYLKGKERRT